MLNPEVSQQADRYVGEFRNASPFPHLVIDHFFETGAAEQLLADFPPFDPANALDEFGKVGRKATIADIRKISPFYARVYDYLGSREFLDCISRLTGIRELVHDEQMFGGGTHENLEGQELDPHVDFNLIEARKLHRRLNVLLYLNKEWEEDWGGCLEIHSNPRRPKEDSVKVVAPAFNRCVIFETSERSWHGFERIRLPENKKHVSRKLLSIYLYTRERPAEEIVPSHGTFYVQRPLPRHIVAGRTLTAQDVQDIENLFTRRDGWIEHYQKWELSNGRHLQDLARQIEWLTGNIRIPLTGFVLQEHPATGFWPDGWISSPFEVTIRAREPMTSLVLMAEAPSRMRGSLEVNATVNGREVSRHRVQPGPLSLEIPAVANTGELVTLRLHSDRTYCPAEAGESDDARKLLLRLTELRAMPRAEGLWDTVKKNLKSRN